jgi:(1->4)-alpha-D-glucan 1-alpha-D-glucosylmutase
MPQEWARAIRRWHTTNRKHLMEIDGETAPDANEEYLLYQTLIGTWPLQPMSSAERAEYAQRIKDYMVKALHEGKINSSWTEPNNAWDEATMEFVEKILTPRRGNRFLQDFEPMARLIARIGMVNSLAQTVLKLTIPGVPDIYQGQEMWDFSLVDPDNRRPIDYAARSQNAERLIEQSSTPADLLENWRDGRIKLLVTLKLLRFRREHPELFRKGSYSPAQVSGKFAECCVAFTRECEGRAVLVVVPRLSSRVGIPAVGVAWSDTQLTFSSPLGSAVDVFTGAKGSLGENVYVRDLLREFPFAVWDVAQRA